MSYEEDEYESYAQAQFEKHVEDTRPELVETTLKLDKAAVERAAAHILIEHLGADLKELRRVAQRTLEDQVSKIVREMATEVINKAIAECIIEGWQETNSYGERTGKVLSLKDRVSKLVTEFDRYRSEGFIQSLIRESVTRLFNEEFEAEIAKAKADLRQKLNVAVTDKFAAVVKSAFGISS